MDEMFHFWILTMAGSENLHMVKHGFGKPALVGFATHAARGGSINFKEPGLGVSYLRGLWVLIAILFQAFMVTIVMIICDK